MKKHIGAIIRGARGIAHDRAQTYPPIPKTVQRTIIARSVEGLPIYAYKIGSGKTPILLSSGLHGNEVGTVKLARNIIKWLHSTDLNMDATYYITPCLNPDGFAQAKAKPGYFSGGKTGRFNVHKVDLNRNFDTTSFISTAKWNFGKNYSQSRSVFAGSKAFSEPETKGIADFIIKNKINIWFMFHNAGSDVLPSCDNVAQRLAQIIAKESGFKLYSEQEWKELKQTGTPKEWCEEKKISFIEIEGSDRWSSDWPVLKPALEAAFRNI